MTYLPPVVVRIVGTDKDLLAKLAEATAGLSTFARTLTETKLGADDEPLVATMAKADASLMAWASKVSDARIGLDTTQFYTDFATMQAAADKGITIPIRTDGAGRSLLGGLLGGLFGGAGGGGGGLLAALGWGGGKGIGGALGGMAGFGSILSLMGFGAEHVAATGIGIGGSMLGAGLGAGFLGVGALGTGAVGMGTDMAGIGQAMNDVKKYRTAVNQANVAQAQYAATVQMFGANSQQAATALTNLKMAQANVNATLATMPKAARGAIVSLSSTLTQFKTLFDQATGVAEAKGARIIQSLVTVAEKFLPTIGKFASENMSIIAKALAPFEKWLTGPGLKIFQNLEKVFQAHLPTGMHALEQGFELLAKTITIASGYLGHFISWINSFLTRMNGATFGKWSHFVRDMITSFNDWFGLLKSVGKAVFDLFQPAVGLGDQLAKLLTTIFNQIGGWLRHSHTLLHGLFTAHAKELITGIGAAIRALLPIVEQFTAAFVTFATGGAQVATVLLKGLASVLRWIADIPFASKIIGWGAALLFFGPKVLTGVMALGRFVAGIPGFIAGVASVVSGVVKMTAQFAVMIARWVAGAAVWIAENAAMAISATAAFIAENAATLGIIAGIAALVGGIIYLATHWHQVWTDIKNWTMDAWHWLDGALHAIPGWILALVAPLVYVALHWKEIWADAKEIWHDILAFFKTLPGEMLKIGKDVIMGLVHGIEGAVGTVVNTAKHVAHDVWHAVTSFFGIFSPSRLMMQVGHYVVEGMSKGMRDAHSHVAAAQKIATEVRKAITPSLPKEGYRIGENFDAQLAQGLLDNKGRAVAAAASVVQAVNAQLASIGSGASSVAAINGRLTAGRSRG